jgi:hypothetical protein
MSNQRTKDDFLIFLIYGYWDKRYCCRILASMYLNQ